MRHTTAMLHRLLAALASVAVALGLGLSATAPSQAEDVIMSAGHWTLTGWYTNEDNPTEQNLQFDNCNVGGCTHVVGDIRGGYPRSVWVKRWHAADPNGAYGWGYVTVNFSWTTLPETLPNGAPFDLTLRSELLDTNGWKIPNDLQTFYGMFAKAQGMARHFGNEVSDVPDSWTGSINFSHYLGMPENMTRYLHISGGGAWSLALVYTWTPDPEPAPDPNPVSAPAIPGNVKISGTSKRVFASWSASAGATGYRVTVTGRSPKNKKVSKSKSTPGMNTTFKVRLKLRSKVRVCVSATSAGGTSAARCARGLIS